MTQDSAIVWVLGLILTVVTALLGFSGLFPANIELYLKVAAGVIAVVTAYLKASPLPRKMYTEEERAKLSTK